MAVRIEKIVSDALGFCHDGQRALFIDGALPGELVEYAVREEKNGYAMAVLEEEVSRCLTMRYSGLDFPGEVERKEVTGLQCAA